MALSWHPSAAAALGFCRPARRVLPQIPRYTNFPLWADPASACGRCVARPEAPMLPACHPCAPLHSRDSATLRSRAVLTTCCREPYVGDGRQQDGSRPPLTGASQAVRRARWIVRCSRPDPGGAGGSGRASPPPAWCQPAGALRRSAVRQAAWPARRTPRPVHGEGEDGTAGDRAAHGAGVRIRRCPATGATTIAVGRCRWRGEEAGAATSKQAGSKKS